jgi:outer membrane protein OmpA-like peptidoglycan-associated protein
MTKNISKYLCMAMVLGLSACANTGDVKLKLSDHSLDAGRERYLVYFAHDSYALDDIATKQVEDLFQEVSRESGVMLSVNGHTDTTGSDRYNMMLSNERADAVRDMLLSLGLEDAQIQTYGFGETDPAVPTPDETFEPQNRRVEVVVN